MRALPLHSMGGPPFIDGDLVRDAGGRAFEVFAPRWWQIHRWPRWWFASDRWRIVEHGFDGATRDLRLVPKGKGGR